MSNFTDVFHALDHRNKGYILIDDFKNEMQKYIAVNQNSHSKNILCKLIDVAKLTEDGRINFEDFVNVIREHERFVNDPASCIEEKGNSDHISDFSPFINDGDNYSTGDSGFDNEGRVCPDYNNVMNLNVGKQNRKLIKRFQQIDTIQGKAVLPHRLSQVESNDFCDKNADDIRLPGEDLSSSFSGRRRQSDFVTCSSRKADNRTKHNRDNDTYSLNCWTPCSGSAADLFYHDSMTDIQSKLENLERSMDNLQNLSSESKHSKRKYVDENYFLLGQIQLLEEKNRELQKQFEKDLCLERDSARRNITRLDKSRSEELEYLKSRLKSKEIEQETQRKELHVALADTERLRQDNRRSEDKMKDLQHQMSSIEEEMKRLKDFHCKELDLLIRERNNLFAKARELDEASKTKSFYSHRPSLDDISRLRSENYELKRRMEEYESEFLAISVQQGQNILQCTSFDNSWLTEVDGYTKDEVIQLLVKEKDANFRLREYVSRILTRIIDKDPSLLEIS